MKRYGPKKGKKNNPNEEQTNRIGAEDSRGGGPRTDLVNRPRKVDCNRDKRIESDNNLSARKNLDFRS